jgi:ribosomal protein L40E
VSHVLIAQPSCPKCGARASAQAEACAGCGYRFVEDAPHSPRATRTGGRRAGAVALAAIAIIGLAYTAGSLVAGGGQEASVARPDERRAAGGLRVGLDVLSSNPLSTRAVERRLEARFAQPHHDGSATARCSGLQPRPAHAIRRCNINHPGGGESFVVVMTNPHGQEVLVDRWGARPRR